MRMCAHTRTPTYTRMGVLVDSKNTLSANTILVSLHLVLACVLVGCAPHTDATLLFACTATNDVYVLASAAAASHTAGALGVPIRRFDTVYEALANGWTHGDALLVMSDEGCVHQWPSLVNGPSLVKVIIIVVIVVMCACVC